jgi:zinc finger protein 830
MASNPAKSSLKLLGTAKKIDSPLAKYNSAGQLTCIVCNSVVKNELVWTAHINGRQHREKVLSLKNPKVEAQFTKPQIIPAVKRKADSIVTNGSAASPSKKGVPKDFFDNQSPNFNAPMPIKGILKNSTKPVYDSRVVRIEAPTLIEDMDTNDPLELFSETSSATEKSTSHPGEGIPSKAIPEGFFDDPKMDAKV